MIAWNPTQVHERDKHESVTFLKGLSWGLIVSIPLWLALLKTVLR